jgi:hypothetical protein
MVYAKEPNEGRKRVESYAKNPVILWVESYVPRSHSSPIDKQ